ncbi:MAG: adenine phosphoribosyltransferase [Candidatus Babeliales bacterium]|jgi:adenine phosphoribosyltransferase
MKRHSGLLFSALMALTTSALPARTITVAITSESHQKVSAVQESFNQKFPDDTIIYVPQKTSSLIPEQPIGIDCALRGARNRLNTVPERLLKTADYVVSIENYIEQSPATQRWYDKGLVVVRQTSPSRDIVEISRPTFIPEKYVHVAQQMSSEISHDGYSVTVGTAIQKSFSDRSIDPSNWHCEAEFGGVSRQQLLKDTIDKALYADELNFLKSLVATHPDFPKPGILFQNMLPILNNAQAFHFMIDFLAQRYTTKNISAVVGLESRGFILAAALAYKLGVGFVPVRKPGKLPGAVYSVSYQKEYGVDTLVLAQDSLRPGQRVIIIDDLIATGGSARAAIELVQLAGAQPVEFVTLLKVAALDEHVHLSVPSYNLID